MPKIRSTDHRVTEAVSPVARKLNVAWEPATESTARVVETCGIGVYATERALDGMLRFPAASVATAVSDVVPGESGTSTT